MAKLSSINKNNKRIKLSDRFFKKRETLKKIIMDKKISLEERFKAQQKLSKLPRNSAKVRGLDIVIVISSQSKDHSFALLDKMNFPFTKKGEN